MKLYAAPLNFRGLAEEFDVPTDFTPELHAEAAAATDRFAEKRRDARGIPLVTIDPVGSKDLDQAVYLERTAGGYRVLYAIADVAAFIEPGSALESESLRRGQTIYLPDEPARLHPPELSEGDASLLPDVDRPAVLWTFDLDDAGEVAQRRDQTLTFLGRSVEHSDHGRRVLAADFFRQLGVILRQLVIGEGQAEAPQGKARHAILLKDLQPPGNHQREGNDLQYGHQGGRKPDAHQPGQQDGMESGLPVVVAARSAHRPLRHGVRAHDARPESCQRYSPDQQHRQHEQ